MRGRSTGSSAGSGARRNYDAERPLASAPSSDDSYQAGRGLKVGALFALLMRRLRAYGERDRHIETGALVLVTFLGLLYYVLTSDALSASHTSQQIASSVYVPEILVALFRSAAALLSFYTLAAICLDEGGGTSLPVFYESRERGEVNMLGVHRLVPFTVWSFIAFGVYFALAALSSWVHVLGGEVTGLLLAAIPVMFAVACGTALLVSVVVTHYLVPSNFSKGFDVSHYFAWEELVMHNYNVIILGVELVLMGMDISLGMVAFPVLFGIAYVGFANAYAVFGGGIYLYDFLDPRLSGGPLIHVMLLLAIAGLFCIVVAVDALADWNVLAGAVAVGIAVYSIVRFRRPSEH